MFADHAVGRGRTGLTSPLARPGGWRGAYPELLHIGSWTGFMRRKTFSQRRLDIAVLIAIFLLLLCVLPFGWELVSAVLQHL